MNRYPYIFDTEITSDTVQHLIDSTFHYESVDLYLGTEGGFLSPAEVMWRYINQHQDCRLFLTDCVVSAGALVILNFKGEISVTENFEYLSLHNIDRPTYMNRIERYDKEVVQKQIEAVNVRMLGQLFDWGLDSEQIAKIRQGDVVNIYREDLKKLNIPNLKFL